METYDSACAAVLPQVDSTSLVDRTDLEQKVREMYRSVAEDPAAARHFEIGRDLAVRLGYPETLLDAAPAGAVASFAGVGYHLDLARLAPGDRVLDLGSGAGTDVFCAVGLVGSTGLAVGVDFTEAQLTKSRRLATLHGTANVSFVDATIDRLPFENESFDVVISNGVINLSPVKQRVFAEAARVLRPHGRLAISDLVATSPLNEATRRNTELWAACIAGAVPISGYCDGLAEAGFAIVAKRRNDYRFLTERARVASMTYGVESITIAAVRAER
jgi:SAM-dependent methyltransferase